MGAPVTLLLIVSLTGGEVRLEQLRATLRTQLDPALVRLVVRRADGVQNLEQMIDEAAAKGPVAVVTNPRRGSFKIKVALQPDRWVSRVFTFAAGDPIRERNRTVALAIATMTPDWRLAEPLPELEPAPEEAGLVPRLGEAEPFVDAGVPVAVEAPLPVEPADAGPPLEALVVVTPPPASGGFGVDAAFAGSTWPLGLGGQLGGHYCATSLCVGVRVRGQRASLGEVNAVVLRAGAQALGRLQTTLGWPWLKAAVQVSIGPGWVQAQRGEQSRSRWQFEADLAPELSVRLFPSVWLFVQAGVGLTSGPTPIFVNDAQVSALPIVAGQGIAGIRLGR